MLPADRGRRVLGPPARRRRAPVRPRRARHAAPRGRHESLRQRHGRERRRRSSPASPGPSPWSRRTAISSAAPRSRRRRRTACRASSSGWCSRTAACCAATRRSSCRRWARARSPAARSRRRSSVRSRSRACRRRRRDRCEVEIRGKLLHARVVQAAVRAPRQGRRRALSIGYELTEHHYFHGADHEQRPCRPEIPQVPRVGAHSRPTAPSRSASPIMPSRRSATWCSSRCRRSAASRRGRGLRRRRIRQGRFRRLQPGEPARWSRATPTLGGAARADQPGPLRRRLDHAHPPGRQGAVRRAARREGLRSGAGRRNPLTQGGAAMPFIPHTADDVRDMLAAIGAPRHRGAVRRDPGRPARPRARRHPAGAHRNGDRPPDVGARGAGRPAAQLHRRRRLRAPHSGGGVGDRHARRVLQRLHAVPGRGEPGHAAAALRIPDDDGQPDRHAGLERVAVRRRLGAGRGRADGGARASQVEVAAHPGAGDGEPDVPQRAAGRRRRPEAARSKMLPYDPARRHDRRSRASSSTAARTSRRS